MNLKCVASIAAVAALIVFGAVTPVRAVPFVLNGSLEDLDGNFVNDADNFDQLAAGATSIANWTVSAGTTENIAWGQTVTGDGRSAPFGDFFIDLSGFGSESPNGAIEQLLSGLLIGGTYNISLFSSGTIPLVTVGGAVVALSSGSSVVAGIDTYTQLTGTFDAGASNLLLKIANDTPAPQSSLWTTLPLMARREPPRSPSPGHWLYSVSVSRGWAFGGGAVPLVWHPEVAKIESHLWTCVRLPSRRRVG